MKTNFDIIIRFNLYDVYLRQENIDDHPKRVLMKNQSDIQDSVSCGCESNCCPPKKKNYLPKIVFAIILLAAIGVIAFKLVTKPEPVAAASQGSCCPSQGSPGSDSTKTASCDTTKKSSCCP